LDNAAEEGMPMDGEVSESHEESVIAEQQRKIWRLQKKLTKVTKENKRLKSNLEQKYLCVFYLNIIFSFKPFFR
jgi:predicted RNase H-like nuclease (RuvC/YqgF family)